MRIKLTSQCIHVSPTNPPAHFFSPWQALFRIEKVKDTGPVEETFIAQELMGVRCVYCMYVCLSVCVCNGMCVMHVFV